MHRYRPFGVQVEQLVVGILKSDLSRALWSLTRTTQRPSDAFLALTNSVTVMFETTEGRWKCENSNTLIRYLINVLY